MNPYMFCVIVAAGRIERHSGRIFKLCDVPPHAEACKQDRQKGAVPESQCEAPILPALRLSLLSPNRYGFGETEISDGCDQKLYRRSYRKNPWMDSRETVN